MAATVYKEGGGAAQTILGYLLLHISMSVYCLVAGWEEWLIRSIFMHCSLEVETSSLELLA